MAQSLFCFTNFNNEHKFPIKFSNHKAKKSNMRSYGTIKCDQERDHNIGFDEEREKSVNEKKKLRILIAGGGVGGLVLALAAKNRGFDVKVFEKDLSSVRGEGQHRGPIQLSSSALAAIRAIDEDVGEQIVAAGCVTGNRINGLADGLSGEWLAKFDLLTAATKKGLPITQVISRMELQDILVNAVGHGIVNNKAKVVNFVQDPKKVNVILEDGRKYEGDILVGADGISSQVRSKLFGEEEAKYSNYSCYSGVTNFVPPYNDHVGLRAFLGLKKYFVAVEVGNGKMQWYAFHKEASKNTDPPGGKKDRLMDLFGNWCREVIELITKTPEQMIIRRDIYDRDMIWCWGVGRVTLLGDAAHPMQPNLGQGGCMAIEDCHQLIIELEKIVKRGTDDFLSNEIVSALNRYAKKRMSRVSTIHSVSRMASKMLSTYHPYIYFGPNPLSHSSTWRIPQPAFQAVLPLLQTYLSNFMNWTIVGDE